MSINATLFFQIIVFFVLVWFTMKFVLAAHHQGVG